MSEKILELIRKEEKRQRETLMMIPSENYTYPEVREAVGSVLMHKYSEGQVGRRYYQGNEIVDEIEKICKRNVLKVFGLSEDKWSVNVQALSGSPANLAVYNALLEPGDRIMAMYLPDGGHLSHGWEIKPKTQNSKSKKEEVRKVTFVSKIYNVSFYRVDKETQVFDYDKIEAQAKSHKPKLIISGGTAYAREINHKRMGEIAKSVGAFYLADVAHEAGLIAGGVNKSPFEHADVVTMTTHKTLRGPRGAIIVSKKALGAKIEKSVFPGIQGGPHNHTIAGIAIALEKASTPEFKKYAEQVVKNAKRLAENFMEAGLKVVSGGTDKHLVLIDLRDQKVDGKEVAEKLESVGIIVNKNTVPNDKGTPVRPSGIRLGTPAITVRGMKEAEMDLISNWIIKVIENNLEGVLEEVRKLCKKFPIKF